MTDKPKNSETKPQPFTSAEWADADLAARNYINEEIMSGKPKKSEPLIGYVVIDDYTEGMSQWGGVIEYPNPEGATLFWENPEPFIQKSAYDALKLENEELRRALEFYADNKNWGEHGPDMRTWYVIETTDRGAKARAALLKGQK